VETSAQIFGAAFVENLFQRHRREGRRRHSLPVRRIQNTRRVAGDEEVFGEGGAFVVAFPVRRATVSVYGGYRF
jgi:hypothetical protein